MYPYEITAKILCALRPLFPVLRSVAVGAVIWLFIAVLIGIAG